MKQHRKILRVAKSYPRTNMPGMGLHPFYHSLYSKDENLILTSKYDGELVKNKEDVEIIEIPIKEVALGKYEDSKLKRLVSLIRKVNSQISFLNRSKRYIRDFHPDIVHVYTPIPLLCGMYAKRKCGSKIVMSLHGSDALRISKVTFFKKLLTIPDAIVTVGDNMESILPGVSLKRPIVCISNGVDLAVFKNQHQERKKQFIHVASLRWQKGQKYLIEGFAKFHHSHPEYRLVIIGDGEDRSNIQRQCAEEQIAEYVDFKGILGREEIANELNVSTAFVLTSVSEGFPKVIIESMATATPVISSDAGNVRQVVADSGIIFPQKDSDAVCSAMERIISSPDEWKGLSRKSEQYAQQYSWENHIQKLEKIYDDVLKG